jgi:hypothetical protein
MEGVACGSVACAVVRFLCGRLDHKQLSDEVSRVYAEGRIAQTIYEQLSALLPNAQAGSRWGHSAFYALAGERKDEGMIRQVATAADVPPLLALVGLLKAVENADKVLFCKIVQRHRRELGTCRAVCAYLYRVAQETFANLAAAQRFAEMFDNVDHCQWCGARDSLAGIVWV